MSEQTPFAIEKIDIYANPQSSNYDPRLIQNERYGLAGFFKLDPERDIQVITERPTAELIEELHTGAAPVRRLSVSASGDGGAQALVTAISEFNTSQLQPDETPAQTNYVSPLLGVVGTGNGLNIHQSINGTRHARSLSKLLASGKATGGMFYATECDLPDGKTRYATSIVQLGVTEHIAEGLESYRELFGRLPKPARLLSETIATAYYGANYTGRFRVQATGLPVTLPRQEIAGLDLITTSHVAKLGRAPISALNADIFAMHTILTGKSAQRLGQTIVGGLRLAAGKPVGAPAELTGKEGLTLQITSASGPIGLGFDGETGQYLQEGDSLHIRRARFGIPIICARTALNAEYVAS